MHKKILITGGAGFIGSHLVRHFVEKYSNYQIYNLDLLTYAGNLENLKDLEGKKNLTFGCFYMFRWVFFLRTYKILWTRQTSLVCSSTTLILNSG